jgi:hypothetical protein
MRDFCLLFICSPSSSTNGVRTAVVVQPSILSKLNQQTTVKMAADAGYEPTKKIWTTLLSNRAYLAGALVLAHTLRKTGSRYELKITVTRDAEADPEFMDVLAAAGIPTIAVDKLEPAPRADGRVARKGTWEKLAPWGWTEYEVCASFFALYNRNFALSLRETLAAVSFENKKLTEPCV